MATMYADVPKYAQWPKDGSPAYPIRTLRLMANTPNMSIWVKMVSQYDDRKGGRITKTMIAPKIPDFFNLCAFIARIDHVPLTGFYAEKACRSDGEYNRHGKKQREI